MKVRLGIVVLLLLGVLIPVIPSARAAGPPLYPDLKSLNPSQLYFDTASLAGQHHYLLRFSSTVWNAGEGRLEIQGDPDPTGSSGIYQNLYDAPTGGSLATQQFVTNDYTYHPSHYHYHLDDFAEYQLLKRDTTGSYQATSRRGHKTSFCIMDYVRVTSSGPSAGQYSNCNATRQGMSVGWGDTYYASLPNQWIDLGTAPLADGQYAVRVVADPRNKLNEAGRDGNNDAVTYFSVQNGTLLIGSAPPVDPARCSLSPASGPVGASVRLSCQYFGSSEIVRVYWESTSTPSITSFLTAENGSGSVTFQVPQAPAGGYTVFAVGSRTGARVSSQFGVGTSTTISPSSGPVGTRATVNAAGLQGGEQVEVWWYHTATNPTKLTTTAASSDGRLSTTITVPATSAGNHKVEVIGRGSGARSSMTFNVTSSGPEPTPTSVPRRPRGSIATATPPPGPEPTRVATTPATAPPVATAPTSGSRTIRGSTPAPTVSSATSTPAVSPPTASTATPVATSQSRTIRGSETTLSGQSETEPTQTSDSADRSIRSDQPLVAAEAPGAVDQQSLPLVEVIDATSSSITVAIDPLSAGVPATVDVEYGLDEAYGATLTAALSDDGQRYEATIDGLSPETTYHLRAVVTDSGGTRQGDDVTYTTAPLEPTEVPEPTEQTA